MCQLPGYLSLIPVKINITSILLIIFLKTTGSIHREWGVIFGHRHGQQLLVLISTSSKWIIKGGLIPYCMSGNLGWLKENDFNNYLGHLSKSYKFLCFQLLFTIPYSVFQCIFILDSVICKSFFVHILHLISSFLIVLILRRS